MTENTAAVHNPATKRARTSAVFSRQAERLIAQFRGLPTGSMAPRGRPAAALGGLIENLETSLGIGQPGIEATIMANWRKIVGERVAHRCRPGKIIDNRKLVVLTAKPVIRQELNFQRKTLLANIRRLPGCANIHEITIRSA